MHRVQIPDLHEPCANTLHNLPTCLQAASPVGFPFKEISWVQGVRAEFEDATQLTRGCCGPEGEFLHEGRVLRADQSLEVRIECWEVGVGLDVVQGLVIAFISSVFPDMY